MYAKIEKKCYKDPKNDPTKYAKVRSWTNITLFIMSILIVIFTFALRPDLGVFAVVLSMLSVAVIAFNKYSVVKDIRSGTEVECPDSSKICATQLTTMNSIPVDLQPCKSNSTTVRCVAEKAYNACKDAIPKIEDYDSIMSVIFSTQ